MLSGTVASAGIGIGKAIVVNQMDFSVKRQHGMGPKTEKMRFVEAVRKFTAEIHKAAEVIRSTAGNDEAEILQTQISVINDPDLRKELEMILEKDNVNLEYAFCQVCDKFINLMLGLENELFQARAADLCDVKAHVLSILMGVEKIDLSSLPLGSIIVSSDLSPSCTASIDPRNVRAIVTQKGATCSHSCIICKAMGLPTLVEVAGLLESVRDGDILIVDGERGNVMQNPEPQLLESYAAVAPLA